MKETIFRRGKRFSGFGGGGQPPARQEGAVSVMMTGLIFVIIGTFGFALELSQIYNRRAEMQNVADAAALAAAKKLDGTSTGISNALAAAADVVSGLKYQYNTTPMVWSSAAIKFGKAPDDSAGWVDAGAASGSPGGLVYVKVDTSALDEAYGRVDLVFMQVFSSTLATAQVSEVAVAGRARLNAVPLGICAMKTTAAAPRDNQTGKVELEEFGFRRGVSYNLMRLNPNSKTSPANFLLDPLALAGSGSGTFALSIVGPHVCAGTMAVPRLTGANVNVQPGFPLDGLMDQLNSRFDQYNGSCDPIAAPPDTNVKAFPATSIGWMTTVPQRQSANEDNSVALQTVADLAPPSYLDPTTLGPLWAFARAVPWSSYSAGTPEPDTGYTPFSANATTWAGLYPQNVGGTSGPVPKSTYPSGTATPYLAGAYTQLPSIAHRPGLKYRRVLNVPLLQCPVSGSTATVLGVGRFFMTIPATATDLYAEFAGATSEGNLGGPVELYK